MKKLLFNIGLVGSGYLTYNFYNLYLVDVNIARKQNINWLNTNLFELKNIYNPNVYIHYITKIFKDLNVYVDIDLYNNKFEILDNKRYANNSILTKFTPHSDIKINSLILSFIDSLSGYYSYLCNNNSPCVTAHIKSNYIQELKKDQQYFSYTFLGNKSGRNFFIKTIIFDDKANVMSIHEKRFVSINWFNSYKNKKINEKL